MRLEPQWWGCSIAGAKTGQRDEDEGRPVFTLHYDAYQAFEEADHDVCFVDRQVFICFCFRLATARFFMMFLLSLDTEW